MQEEYSFYVAGMKFHQYPRIKPFIKEGDKVLLIPDPDNKFDPHAVKVIYPRGDEFIMLGHVPMKKDLSRKVAEHIRNIKDNAQIDTTTYIGNSVVGIVTYHGLDSPSYQALKIEVTFNV
jgi:hypothetical protein